jgi:hypothetical protein
MRPFLEAWITRGSHDLSNALRYILSCSETFAFLKFLPTVGLQAGFVQTSNCLTAVPVSHSDIPCFQKGAQTFNSKSLLCWRLVTELWFENPLGYVRWSKARGSVMEVVRGDIQMTMLTVVNFDNNNNIIIIRDRLCGLMVRAPGYRSRGQGSIPGATRFSE